MSIFSVLKDKQLAKENEKKELERKIQEQAEIEYSQLGFSEPIDR